MYIVAGSGKSMLAYVLKNHRHFTRLLMTTLTQITDH